MNKLGNNRCSLLNKPLDEHMSYTNLAFCATASLFGIKNLIAACLYNTPPASNSMIPSLTLSIVNWISFEVSQDLSGKNVQSRRRPVAMSAVVATCAIIYQPCFALIQIDSVRDFFHFLLTMLQYPLDGSFACGIVSSYTCEYQLVHPLSTCGTIVETQASQGPGAISG